MEQQELNELHEKVEKIKEVIEKSHRLNDDQIWDYCDVLEDLLSYTKKYNNLSRIETIWYGIEYLNAFEEALSDVSSRQRITNDSIRIVGKEAINKFEQNSFEIEVQPTSLGFLGEVFREFGKNQVKAKK